MTDLYNEAEREMYLAGYRLDKIPRKAHKEHLWADGLLLLWARKKRLNGVGSLPTAEELATDLFDEWDDPVSVEQAQAVLDLLRGP